MGNAGRDPIFWATLAIAEQDFDGVGDLCIRCHSVGGWIAGRSTPTDGSGLQAADDDGVDCDTCHLSTNPDGSEHLGEMFEPFVAYTPITGAEGFYGSGMFSLWAGNEKLGPYLATDAKAKHQRMQSAWHRSEDFCGTCHDVSNSVTGHFAPNHGTQPGATANVITDGPRIHPEPDTITQTNEAYVGLNNPPYAYGIVERTFSEYKSSGFSGMPISNFGNLPADLQVAGGALERAANAAGPTYDDGTARFFTCQSCHMAPLSASGIGANKQGVPSRNDLPVHDLTGGNHWIYPLIQQQDSRGVVRLGGDLNATQIAAMDAGTIRAEDSLRTTISMALNGDVVTLTNLTGHKAITGYPEGRRMWLNIVWKDNAGQTVREDGAYGSLGIQVQNPVDGTYFDPQSILDLHDSNTKIYEAHYGMTKEWADVLLSVGYSESLELSYDRETGLADYNLGMLRDQAPGTSHETFHFAINNTVIKDNRIPPYGMSYDEAERRNALPVPDTQYGNPGSGGAYDYHDVVTLNPPAGAVSADITLYYQGTSWEYVQFLWKGNNTPAGEFLAEEGVNMLDAWVKTGMVPPFAMATATWGTSVCVPTGVSEAICNGVDDDCDEAIDEDWTSTATSCGVGECSAAGQLECQSGTQVDTCTPGPQNEPSDITCDGLDGDCDGPVDEDYIITGTSCGVGACASTGQLECQGGIESDTCTQGLPSAEICNNIDDNCNTSTDEGCDDDGDGYCDDTMTVAGAPVPVCPSSANGPGDDCNDDDLNIYPGGPALRKVGTPNTYYSAFQLAYDNTAPAGILQIQDHEFIETLLLDDTTSVTFQAGYDCSYTTNTGTTIITGDMTINLGEVIIESGTIEIRQN
jgi:hypothetical protein